MKNSQLSTLQVLITRLKNEGIAPLEHAEEALDFWKNKYSTYSYDEKMRYWLSNIHYGMRQPGESIGDSYSEFSKDWYCDVKKREPNFDAIMQEVISLLAFVGVPENSKKVE